MDGDGTYDPGDIQKFLSLKDRYALVKGKRARNRNMSRVHKLGNDILTMSFNVLFGSSIPDICSGMYMLRTDVARSVDLTAHPATPDQVIAAQVVVARLPMTSVPINYRERFAGASRFSTWRQGFRNLWTNVSLARGYNPVFLFSIMASIALVPAVALLVLAAYSYLFLGQYHGGYLLASLMLFSLGGLSLSVSTIDVMLRRTERRVLDAISEKDGVAR